ncbi:acetyl-CoA carboxylase biotin carboxylase subunit [Marinomonas transparens]|uniref:Biotin carboxylase n=1 Tax=Marinomonas transparens TaxID=2795388 RepID=A0A934N718_9GAMM|nr:acetyl-CoA carboxylase biotin carboxylase subunit [Marinomonas transparens]MBJ7538616.1 acetyl-CoA carboxylase biotin carboxylase subunit [Marinomonas transparens]
MFSKVLIANRGEIALRILRACKALSLQTVVVYSTADKDASYVTLADEAYCIGPANSSKSYMNQAALLFVAKVSGAQAVHPGYGFLSENAAFAERVVQAGLIFIGPSADNIRVMGDKIAARNAMLASQVPCVPGSKEALGTDASSLQAMAEEIGFPVIIKAAAGGGGRGMRIVHAPSELIAAVKLTQEEARKTFGNSEVYLEKFLQHPRHIEIQVVSDSHGKAIWLGSRDCSLQRRHQKVLEEAPAPNVDSQLLTAVGERCAQACRAIGYQGAGTFEFLYEDEEFYFIEMNTRIQVEHPVTEITTGIDIVQLQIQIAQGEKIPFEQADVVCVGHALECRINAEDPNSFVPTPGQISGWEAPGGLGVRVDTHIHSGAVISPYYDSMVAKIITHGKDRKEAIEKMRLALRETQLSGILSNIPLHQSLLEDQTICEQSVDIHYLEKLLSESVDRGVKA